MIMYIPNTYVQGLTERNLDSCVYPKGFPYISLEKKCKSLRTSLGQRSSIRILEDSISQNIFPIAFCLNYRIENYKIFSPIYELLCMQFHRDFFLGSNIMEHLFC